MATLARLLDLLFLFFLGGAGMGLDSGDDDSSSWASALDSEAPPCFRLASRGDELTLLSCNLSALRLCGPLVLAALRGTVFSPCEVPLAGLGREGAGDGMSSRRRNIDFLFAAGCVTVAVCVLLLPPLF
jgi:hypothetical protein